MDGVDPRRDHVGNATLGPGVVTQQGVVEFGHHDPLARQQCDCEWGIGRKLAQPHGKTAAPGVPTQDRVTVNLNLRWAVTPMAVMSLVRSVEVPGLG